MGKICADFDAELRWYSDIFGGKPTVIELPTTERCRNERSWKQVESSEVSLPYRRSKGLGPPGRGDPSLQQRDTDDQFESRRGLPSPTADG
ncbi:hypothetical protein J3454_06605 [Erythrobacter sp. NFXS35]|uniref:hypothetical protein n=1 Tax=Erythrobacter sp. NFXS35 TaxID=2818436 RepID=UPI0032DF2272